MKRTAFSAKLCSDNYMEQGDPEGHAADTGRPDSKLDANSTVDLEPLDFNTSPFEELPAKRVETTRARLAYLLLALLSGVLAALLSLLGLRRLTPQEFESVAGVIIAPIVALLGAATGYYYGRGDH